MSGTLATSVTSGAAPQRGDLRERSRGVADQACDARRSDGRIALAHSMVMPASSDKPLVRPAGLIRS
jgi:hypothetical protein